jgi:hypothetical protein
VTTRNFTIEHEGKTYTTEICEIFSTFLGFQDHGIMTFDLQLKRASFSRGIGGYAIEGHAGAWIREVLKTVGVRSWEHVQGKTVFAIIDEHDRGVGFMNLSEDHVFILEDFAKTQRGES